MAFEWLDTLYIFHGLYEKCPRYERSAHTATPRAMLARFDAAKSKN